MLWVALSFAIEIGLQIDFLKFSLKLAVTAQQKRQYLS